MPLIFAVQCICARIGLITRRGLAAVIAQRYGRRWLYPIVLLLFVANVVNIGADIRAIAAVIALLTPIPAVALVAPVGVAIAVIEVVVPYHRFARLLKLLTLVIFAYVLSGARRAAGLGRGAARHAGPALRWTRRRWRRWSPSSAPRSRPTSSSGRPRKKWKKRRTARRTVTTPRRGRSSGRCALTWASAPASPTSASTSSSHLRGDAARGRPDRRADCRRCRRRPASAGG
ncbi:MAG: divalent metal cation transporter [Dehalococcoidia bacterium]